MRYVTDEHKNITHVLVPIDEWNSMLEKKGEDQTINPYQPVIDWLEKTLKEQSPDKSVPSMINLASSISGLQPLRILPAYNILRTILDNQLLLESSPNLMRFGKMTTLLSMSYGFVLKADAKVIAVAYILRNNDFYAALRNTQERISTADSKILSSFGFNLEKFLATASEELLEHLYTGHKSEFVFMAMEEGIVDAFDLSVIKERVRRDPEVLRLFFFDLFEALDEILGLEPDFTEIFKKYPLVDKLAKAVYPNNTLSGSTSRVYKAAKEARQIIASDWKKYVSVN